MMKEKFWVMVRRIEKGIFELHYERPCLWDSDHVPHKLGCTTTEDGYRLEISDLAS